MIDFYIFGFQIMHQIVQTKEGSVDVDEMFGTTVSIHVAQFGALGVAYPQISDLTKKFVVGKVKLFHMKGTRK